jgi:hypothetical protein
MKSPIKKTSVSSSNVPQNFAKSAYSYISPQDLILGKVDIKPEMVSTYISILDSYEAQCSQQTKYKEAEAAQQKKEELQQLAKRHALEATQAQQAKELSQVEDAYRTELDEIEKRFSSKFAKFSDKCELARKELLDHQKAEAEIGVKKIEEKFIIASKETNNNIILMQKNERMLVKQKKYKEAQDIKEQLEQEKLSLLEKMKEEVDKKSVDLFAELEIRNKKNLEDLEAKQEAERSKMAEKKQKEVDALNARYDKIRSLLKTVQEAEVQRLELGSEQNVKVLEQRQGRAQTFMTVRAANNSSAQKKVIMSKISKLSS